MEKINNHEFGQFILKLRNEKRWTQKELAEKLDISDKTVSKWERGYGMPDIMSLKPLSQILGVTVTELLDAKKGKIQEIEESAGRLLSTTLTDALPDSSLLTSDEEIMDMEYREMAENLDYACRVFSLLHDNNQKYFMKYFDVFTGLKAYEIALLELFTQVSVEDKDYIIENMVIVYCGLKEMREHPDTCEKIAAYILMIQESEKVEDEDMRKFSNIPKKHRETEIIKVFRNKLDKKNGICIEIMSICLHQLITCEAIDWHFLMLVQMLSLKDRGENSTYYGGFVGDKVYALIDYIGKLADKYK